jgi:hypothetical protein
MLYCLVMPAQCLTGMANQRGKGDSLPCSPGSEVLSGEYF